MRSRCKRITVSDQSQRVARGEGGFSGGLAIPRFLLDYADYSEPRSERPNPFRLSAADYDVER
jgi:hypothetical protein